MESWSVSQVKKNMVGCMSSVECPLEAGDHETIVITVSVFCDSCLALLYCLVQSQRRKLDVLALRFGKSSDS